jgi:hypothetical protein
MDSGFQDDLLQSYSETELMGYIRATPPLAPLSNVCLLSKNLLAKLYYAPEMEDALKAMETAHQLGIRVPCVKRTIWSGYKAWCIMERILGSTLEDVWKQLTWFTTIKLSLQLRYFCPTPEVVNLLYCRVIGNRPMQIILSGRSLRSACEVESRGYHIFH